MIIFRNFNLSRLLSSQVAPVRLGGEPSRSNAFLYFLSRHKLAGGFILRIRWRLHLRSLLPSLLRTSSQSQGGETVDQSVSVVVPRKKRAVLLRVESSVIRP